MLDDLLIFKCKRNRG